MLTLQIVSSFKQANSLKQQKWHQKLFHRSLIPEFGREEDTIWNISRDAHAWSPIPAAEVVNQVDSPLEFGKATGQLVLSTVDVYR
jgi:hypothetical protein